MNVIGIAWNPSKIKLECFEARDLLDPGKQPINRSIAVMPELFNDNVDSCLGICSDYIQNYKQ